ncbi:MAG: hypothetical protein WCF84_17340 [Anaerolineae bacterium]
MLSFFLFLLRLFGRRWGIPPAVADYLAASTRLGRDSQIPTQLIPIALRLWARGRLNLEFLDDHSDWVLPYWAVHQLNPGDPAYSARGFQPVLLNTGYRDWTGIGNPASPREAIVDPRGLVTPQFDGWSLDTWLRVDDELFFPSRMETPYLEQRLDENLPIVQTRYEPRGLRVLQEAFAVKDSGNNDWVIAATTVENPRGDPRTATLYLCPRPFNPEGVGLIKQIEFRPGQGETPYTFWVNASLGGLIPQPDAVACANEQRGDVAFEILALDSSKQAASPAGVATGAAAYQIELAPHTSRIITGVLPMTAVSQVPAEVVAWTRPEEFVKLKRATATRWRDLMAQGMRIRVPDDRLQDAFEANKAYLLLFHDGDFITPGPYTYHEFWFRDAAYMLHALDQLGYHDQVADVLKTFPRRQQKDGYFLAQEGEWDSNGQALWTWAEHTRLSGELQTLAEQYWPMLNAAHWIDYKRQATRNNPERLPEHGLFPSGMSAEHLGANDFFYWDDLWGLAGLRAAGYAAKLFDKKEDALKLDAAYQAFSADLDASLARAAERTHAAWMPASPYRNADSAMVGNLVALYPLQLLTPDDPRIVATLDELRRVAWQEGTFFHQVGHAGFGTYLALHVAGCYLYQRRTEAWPIIFWLLQHATPTFTWAEAISPQTHHGDMGDGHHGWAAADWISIVRNALLFEEGQHLVLTPALPIDWTHETLSLQVDKAATNFGEVGYTIAFGERAATLVLRANWREPPEYIEWNLPFQLKTASGDTSGVELVDNRVRIPHTVRKVVAMW